MESVLVVNQDELGLRYVVRGVVHKLALALPASLQAWASQKRAT